MKIKTTGFATVALFTPVTLKLLPYKHCPYSLPAAKPVIFLRAFAGYHLPLLLFGDSVCT
jgi:hypothetical protein